MKIYIIRTVKVFAWFFLGSIIIAISILFGTQFGHNLRIIAAESFLTSQHPQFAKFAFLSQTELTNLTNSVKNPKWQNSKITNNINFSNKELEKKKYDPLIITIETINQKYQDHYFEGKLMTVSNPLNVKLVTQQGTQGKDVGEKIYVMAKRNHALAAVNASGFADATGHGGGKIGLGTVIANGHIVNTPGNSNTPTIITGLTKYGQMVTGDYSANQLLHMNVISAAGFMPQLIVNGEKMITHGNGGWGYGPRTIMAQKKDGTIMFLVVDGRQPHSIGASLKDCQDLLYKYGAYNAMAMDGGSSATLFALGNVLNIPSTLSHNSRYLPNSWVVTANQNQKVEVTVDGQPATQEKITAITGLSTLVTKK
ncbi:phosphodiester glycosidase family protein [Ectobacillus panaciterrae]|uniref:phosphodiester glycosidase family protein n=1 Tax=Ectobacillus panaciterrae TaxID=363872 RepID=UPI0004072D4B|nr:phosphodiester glycosidase family protein [Ectobacillus panaciterrae]